MCFPVMISRTSCICTNNRLCNKIFLHSFELNMQNLQYCSLLLYRRLKCHLDILPTCTIGVLFCSYLHILSCLKIVRSLMASLMRLYYMLYIFSRKTNEVISEFNHRGVRECKEYINNEWDVFLFNVVSFIDSKGISQNYPININFHFLCL